MTVGEKAAEAGTGNPPEVLDGPFSTRQLLRIDEALRLADQGTGLIFSSTSAASTSRSASTPSGCTASSPTRTGRC